MLRIDLCLRFFGVLLFCLCLCLGFWFVWVATILLDLLLLVFPVYFGAVVYLVYCLFAVGRLVC